MVLRIFLQNSINNMDYHSISWGKMPLNGDFAPFLLNDFCHRHLSKYIFLQYNIRRTTLYKKVKGAFRYEGSMGINACSICFGNAEQNYCWKHFGKYDKREFKQFFGKTDSIKV